MRILVTGGTGLLGNAIGRRLARGHQLLVLSREGKASKDRVTYPCELIPWDGESDLSSRVMEGVEAIIHLAGASIADGRWTEARKKVLRDSRVHPLNGLKKSLIAAGRQPKVLISASGVGFYGDRGDEPLSETSNAGQDFLANLCLDWERSAMDLGARRTVILRLGVVLSPSGGFLSEVVKMFRRFGAARLGSGRQYLSWVHIDDVVEVVSQALTNPAFSGPINVTAPEPVTNSEMTDVLAKALNCFRGPPAPGFALKLLYGEKSQLLLASQRALPERLRDLKLTYRHPNFSNVIDSIFKK